MRTRSIVTLSLSPVGLLLLYGLSNIVNGASKPAVATSTPEADNTRLQSNQAQAQSVRPTPSPVEVKSQPEYSAAPVQSAAPLPLPSTSQPPLTLPALPSLSDGKFNFATVRVDATKLDRVIERSFGHTSVEPDSDIALSAIPTATPAVAPASERSEAPAVAIAAAPTQPSATAALTATVNDTLRSNTEFTSLIAPPELAQLDAIEFIASSNIAVPETFQLAPDQIAEPVDSSETPALSTTFLPASVLSPELQPASSTVHPPATSASQRQSPQFSPQAPEIAQMPAPAAPPSSTATPAAAGGTSTNDAYILGPGDVIQLNFFNVPEYNGQLQVMPDGTVNLPVVGSTAVSGMTLKQASEAIGVRYASELSYSVVSVYLIQPRPLQIGLVGEITQPGLYSIPANQGGQFPAVVQAIQTAGGVTQSANLQQVEIRRKDQTGTVRTMTVNLLALLQQGDLSQNSLLQDGDVIFIPAATEISLANTNQLAVSNLRSNTTTPLDVSVVGEVSRPGPYRMEGAEGRSTLVQAIQQAGGFTPTADLSQIQLRRKTRQGTEQMVAINLWQLLQTGDLTQDLVLQQGDTVVIPTARELTTTETAALTASSLSTGTIQVNLIGEVESPGAQQLQANTTLNQAVLAAGGFNGRAKGVVKLIRFNPNGTLTQQRIDVDLTQELNSEANPILHNNDVILVGRSTGARIRDGLSDALEIFQLISPFIPF